MLSSPLLLVGYIGCRPTSVVFSYMDYAAIGGSSPSCCEGPDLLFRGRGEAMGRSPRSKGPIAGMGFLKRGQPASSPQARGLGSAISSPSEVRSRCTAAKRVSCMLEAPEGLSWNLMGAKFGGGGVAALPPPRLHPPMYAAQGTGTEIGARQRPWRLLRGCNHAATV